MKKLILTLTLLVIGVTVVSAQKQWLGGALSFDYSKTKAGASEAKQTKFDILPEYGYFFNESWAIAARAGYSYNKIDESKINAFVINPFVRHTFLKGSIGSLFLDGGVRAEFGKQKLGARDENTLGLSVGINPGAIINVGNGFSLYALFGGVGYKHSEWKVDPKQKTDSFSIGFDFTSPTVGLFYAF